MTSLDNQYLALDQVLDQAMAKELGITSEMVHYMRSRLIGSDYDGDVAKLLDEITLHMTNIPLYDSMIGFLQTMTVDQLTILMRPVHDIEN